MFHLPTNWQAARRGHRGTPQRSPRRPRARQRHGQPELPFARPGGRHDQNSRRRGGPHRRSAGGRRGGGVMRSAHRGERVKRAPRTKGD